MTSNDGNNDALSTKPRKLSDLKIFGIGSLIYIIVAPISFYLVIPQFYGKHTKRFLDACYFAIVLMTSSGYKDLKPNNNLAILLAILFAIFGILIFGALMSLGADRILVEQPKPFTVLDSAKNHQRVQYSSMMLIKYWKVLAVWLAVHMVGGIYLLACHGKMHISRALYCVSSTITTVIGIDQCFSTEGRRIIALIWILDGIIYLSAIICFLTEGWKQRTKWLSVKKYLKRKPTLAELQQSDFDKDGFIMCDAYVRYRLKEIKLLRQAGIEPKFKKLGRRTNSTYRRSKPSFKDYIPKLENSDDIIDTIIIFILYLVPSIIIFYVARDHIFGKKTNTILDAVYFSFIIITSVGYGDLSPEGTLALIFASFFSLSGLLVIGKVLSTTLEAVDNKQVDKLRKLLASIKDKDQTIATRKESILKRLKSKAIVFVVLMVIGTLIVFFIEDLDFLRAIYCISIMITSAGTEICFSTKSGRVVALLWMIFCAIYKGWVFFTFTEVYIEEKQRLEVSRRQQEDYPPPPMPPPPPPPRMAPKPKTKRPPSPPMPPPPPPPPPMPPPVKPMSAPPPPPMPPPVPTPMSAPPPPWMAPPPTPMPPPPPPPPPMPPPPPPPPPMPPPPTKKPDYPPPQFGTPDFIPHFQPIFGTPDSDLPQESLGPPWPFYPPSEVDLSEPYPEPKRHYGDDGDHPMFPDDLIEEGMPIRKDDDEAALEEEFKRLDVGNTGRLTLDEVMKS